MKALFETFPLIQSERFLLGPLLPEHASDLFELYTDREVVRCLDRESPLTVQQAMDDLLELDKLYLEQKAITWGIFSSANELIGVCRFYSINHKHRFCNIGYELKSSYWGKGIMKECLTALSHFTFAKTHMNRLQAETHAGNHRSIRLLESLGFSLEGRERENFLIDNTFHDSLLYSLLRKDQLRQ